MGALSDPVVNNLLLPVTGDADDGRTDSFREPATAVKLRRDALGMRAAKAEATLAVRERFGRWCMSYASVVAGVVVVVKEGEEEEGEGTSGGKRGQVGSEERLVVNRTFAIEFWGSRTG